MLEWKRNLATGLEMGLVKISRGDPGEVAAG